MVDPLRHRGKFKESNLINNDPPHRRASDDLILDMHGMLKTVIAQFDDHKAQDEKEFLVIHGQLKPLNEFHEAAKAFKWPAVWILAPTFAGVGALVWDKVKHLFGGNN